MAELHMCTLTVDFLTQHACHLKILTTCHNTCSSYFSQLIHDILTCDMKIVFSPYRMSWISFWN